MENIKTGTEFDEFADIWYQRAYRLLKVYQNEKETPERRLKAFILWFIMHEKIMKLIPTHVFLFAKAIKKLDF